MSQPSEGQWDAFVLAHPRAAFFHRSAWRHVASSVFGHRPHYLTVDGDDGRLAAVLPLVEVKSRLFGHALIANAFCIGGGPLAADDAAMAAVLAQAEALGKTPAVDYVELRDTPEAGAGWVVRDDLYANFARPIAAGEEDNLLQIPRKQRAVVRKALAKDFTITVERSTEHFFPLYAGTMRDHGTPALPRRFFETLLATFGEDCDVLTVHQNGRPVSSVLSYYFRGAVLPYYTGSLGQARISGANDMMYWALMRRAVERGCTTFDFGRSKIGAGPYNFKRNWGFEPRPISHQYRLLKGESLPNLNPTNPRYALFIKAWRRLPVPVATAISPILSRNLA
jgi:FemAB-related protein (PEP-CTERM system-associated)